MTGIGGLRDIASRGFARVSPPGWGPMTLYYSRDARRCLLSSRRSLLPSMAGTPPPSSSAGVGLAASPGALTSPESHHGAYDHGCHPRVDGDARRRRTHGGTVAGFSWCAGARGRGGKEQSAQATDMLPTTSAVVLWLLGALRVKEGRGVEVRRLQRPRWWRRASSSS